MVNATSPLPAARSVASLRFFMKFRAPQALKDNLGVFVEEIVRGPGSTMVDFNNSVSVGIASRANTIQSATRAEPYSVERDHNNVYQGAINYAPNYATCP